MLLVTPYLEGFTLEELTEHLHLNNVHLTKDSSISVFLSILNIIKVADSKGLIVSPMPDNLFFISKAYDEKAIFSTEKYSFELKILATSKQWLHCGKSKLEKLYPTKQRRAHVDGMIWGASLSLYAFVSSEPLSKLPAINDWNDIERGDLFKLFYEDGALAYILKNSLKSSIPANFTSHPYIKI